MSTYNDYELEMAKQHSDSIIAEFKHNTQVKELKKFQNQKSSAPTWRKQLGQQLIRPGERLNPGAQPCQC